MLKRRELIRLTLILNLAKKVGFPSPLLIFKYTETFDIHLVYGLETLKAPVQDVVKALPTYIKR